MCTSVFKCTIILTITVAFIITSCYSLKYSDLEALKVNCPSKDKCEGYKNDLLYTDRSCQCDSKCTVYNDCCIDALPLQNLGSKVRKPRRGMKCIQYGEDDLIGVFVISKCSKNWNGSSKVKEMCLNSSDDLSDPFVDAPVIDISQKKTYRNMACAECNNANMASLKHFIIKLSCKGLEKLTAQQIMSDLAYSQQYRLWGIIRSNRFDNETEFTSCNLTFDLPNYLKDKVRFCRPNLISTCARDWNNSTIANLCSRYMTAVYSMSHGYRNPHCAICNHENIDAVSCSNDIDTERNSEEEEKKMKKMFFFSFTLLLDINLSDGEYVGMKIVTQECPPDHIYDPFAKKCRKLTCLIQNYVIVDGKCVPPS